MITSFFIEKRKLEFISSTTDRKPLKEKFTYISQHLDINFLCMFHTLHRNISSLPSETLLPTHHYYTH